MIIIIEIILSCSVDFISQGLGSADLGNKVNQNSNEPWLIDGCRPDIVHNPTGGAFYLIKTYRMMC